MFVMLLLFVWWWKPNEVERKNTLNSFGFKMFFELVTVYAPNFVTRDQFQA